MIIKSVPLTHEVFVSIIGSYSNHSDLAEDGKGNPVDLPHKAVDLFIAAGLLLAELVAGEGQNVEMKRTEVFLQLLEVFVMLISVTALAGHIHNQWHLQTQYSHIKNIIRHTWLLPSGLCSISR